MVEEQEGKISYRSITARAEKAGISREEFVASLNKKSKETLSDIGFTVEQIENMYQERKERLGLEAPFYSTDIWKRYEEFSKVFKPYGIKPKKLCEILSVGLMFSQEPRQYRILFKFVEKAGIPVTKFLQLAKTENGRHVLARSPQNLIKNIKQMAKVLTPYGITQTKWIKMGLFRPTLLRQTSDYLCENINRFSNYLTNLGYSKADWIEAGSRNPGILDRNVDTLLLRQKEMSAFLVTYGVTPSDWAGTCLKVPQLFYMTSEYIQERFQFYIQAYEAGDFVFTKLEEQNTKHLIKTLLTSPQYLCCSDDNLKARREYMDMKKQTHTVATSAAIYMSLSKIKECLQNGM